MAALLEFPSPAEMAKAAVEQLSRVYTVEALAVRLNIGKHNAYELIRDGLISYFCPGKKNYRVTEADVLDYIERTKTRAA